MLAITGLERKSIWMLIKPNGFTQVLFVSSPIRNIEELRQKGSVKRTKILRSMHRIEKKAGLNMSLTKHFIKVSIHCKACTWSSGVNTESKAKTLADRHKQRSLHNQFYDVGEG